MLDTPANASMLTSLPQKTGVRIGVLYLSGDEPQTQCLAAFFMAVRTSMGDRSGEPQGSPVALVRYSNPVRSSTMIGVMGDGYQTVLEYTMTSIAKSAIAPVSQFNFNSHAVRVAMRDGEPWFVATDVCKALGYVNPSKAVADHLDDDERSHEQLDRSRMGSKAVVINESGLYALVLRSRKPEARKFAKWVTGEVLPSIRKTGGYSQPAAQQFSTGRWLVSFDDQGRETATRIPNGAIVATLPRLAEMLLMPGGMAPTPEELTALAHACIQRLHARAQTKPNTQLKLEHH